MTILEQSFPNFSQIRNLEDNRYVLILGLPAALYYILSAVPEAALLDCA